MDEELIKSLKNASEKGIEFIETQAPTLCSEVVNYGGIYHNLFAIFGLILIVLSISFIKRTIAATHNSDEEIFMGVAAMLSCLIGLATFLIHLSWALQVFIAPRMYILEWISSLTKGD